MAQKMSIHAIPEFIRILVDEEHIVFEEALSIAKQVFTNT